ncbi:MAG: hypothetical protein NTZ85_01250 [Bacteroidia bacterium]|nr:hypothetical protein [Bacteroidia bacterium]
MKSIIYKEWIKIKGTFLAFLVLGLIALTIVFLRVRHDILFVDAANYWYSFLFRGSPYYMLLKYLPAVAGLGIAIAQYFPETVDKRIKLTFHLPVEENEILIMMHAFGAATIISMFLFFFLIFIAGSSLFFPSDIIIPSLISIVPWFLGGVAIYFMVSLILLEPIWLYRGLFAIIGGGFITFFYINASIGGYKPIIVSLLLLTALSSIVVLFTGYRFRKGEM